MYAVMQINCKQHRQSAEVKSITEIFHLSISKQNSKSWELFKKRHAIGTSEAVMALIRADNAKSGMVNDR